MIDLLTEVMSMLMYERIEGIAADGPIRMRPHALFFLPHLGGGGAEMNAVRVASALGCHGCDASFAVGRGPGSYARMLPESVGVKVLDTGRIDSSTLRLMRSVRPLRQWVAKERPDLVCSFMDAPSLAMLKALWKCADRPRLVLSIQNSLTARYLDKRNLRSMLELQLIRKWYPRADHIVALSQGVASELEQLVREVRDRITVIHNAGLQESPGQQNNALPVAPRPDTGQVIVACGRLVEQKGYPYLLRAFAEAARDRDVWLWILGEGPLKGTLTELAETLGIGERVKFLGFQDDPHAYMRAADVFVLSSLWEGFGNVIVEAMAAGAPVVSTCCPHGPGEIIEHDVNGLLVPPRDEAALSKALLRVLNDEALREQLRRAGLDRAKDFSPDNIARQYAAVFDYVLSARP